MGKLHPIVPFLRKLGFEGKVNEIPLDPDFTFERFVDSAQDMLALAVEAGVYERDSEIKCLGRRIINSIFEDGPEWNRNSMIERMAGYIVENEHVKADLASWSKERSI